MKDKVLEILLRKKSFFTRNNGKINYPKVVSYYYGEKGHIKPIYHIRNVKFPGDLMT